MPSGVASGRPGAAEDLWSDDLDDDRVGILRRVWALVRWVVLVLAVGLGAAALVAMATAALFSALDANL